jgi:L,D-transpeptidase ErfK/SrfK
MKIKLLLTLSFILILASHIDAGVHSYSRDNTVIGNIRTYEVGEDESLIEIARRFDLGYNEIMGANPDLDPFAPGNGATVLIPALWILPDVTKHHGIVINLSEMRLYYFLNEKKRVSVMTYPIGMGQEGFDTPVGVFSIIEKKVKPDWHPPASIRNERPELPLVVPHGPENPLGSHALRLSSGTILIHGTHRPWGVGRKVSHGCIRLYPEDIPKLFDAVKSGTRVVIVRQPVKAGVKDNKVYIEVHNDDHDEDLDYMDEAVKILRKKGLLKNTNSEKLYQALRERSGVPVEISD